MKKLVLFFLTVSVLFLSLRHPVLAQEHPQEYYKSEVVKIDKEGQKNVFGHQLFFQNLKIKLLEGDQKGKIISIENSGAPKTAEHKRLDPGDKIIVLEINEGEKITYSIWDKYRLDSIIYILIGFFILVVIFAGLKGIGSILGMGISLATLLLFVVPQIINGKDPLLISILGAIFIMFVSIYLAHGFSRKTTIAVASTSISLIITGILAYIFVSLGHLSGVGSEEAYNLQIGPYNINTKGLLLGGIIIGTLGVLDDITTAQAAAVNELAKSNPKLTMTDLIYRGYMIGKEHIASLVNTLVLAYAGASFSIFILFVLNPSNNPYWVILNSEIIVEEVIRTLAGSIGLILAVPITTLMAAWFFKKSEQKR